MSDDSTKEEFVNSVLYECFFADDEGVEEDDGLVWKDILREGEWAYRPGPGQKPIPLPLKVVRGNSASREEIGMQDLIDAFEDGAVEHVTVPTSHEDKPHENTGYVKALKIVQSEDGDYRLRAGIEFTEPDIKEKVQRRSIANSSAGIIFDYIHKQSGKKYRQALGHLALTNKPWITGNKPFGVAASENFSEDQIVPVVEDEGEEDLDEKLIEALETLEIYDKFDFRDFSGSSREKLAKKGYALPDGSYPIVTIQDLKNAIQAFGRAPEGKRAQVKRHIIKRAKALGATNLLPDDWKTNLSEKGATTGAENQTHNKTKEEKMGDVDETQVETPGSSNDSAPEVTLSEDALNQLRDELKSDFEAKLSEKDSQLAEYRSRVHRMEVDERIAELQTEGFSEYPGLLAEIRTLMLADSGEKVLTFSEKPAEGDTEVEVKLSASEVINRLISALPKKDGKLALSEQTNELENHSEPKSETEEVTLSEDERIAKLAEELGRELPKNKDGDS